MIFKIKNISSKDIFIDEPTELFIQGKNLLSDFDSTINFIGLADMIDVKETREIQKNKLKCLEDS